MALIAGKTDSPPVAAPVVVSDDDDDGVFPPPFFLRCLCPSPKQRWLVEQEGLGADDKVGRINIHDSCLLCVSDMALIPPKIRPPDSHERN